MASEQRGFTLIEMMMVVGIIAILSAIAIPSYRDYVTRSRIIEATAGLGDARNKMEQYFQDNRVYPTGCVIQPNAPGATQVQLQALQNFALACNFPSTTQYTVTATGAAPMAGFVYDINEQNVRTSTFSGSDAAGYTAASPNTCWVVRKGGLCS
jgi:type IV pilus assembly protein PilE